MRRNEACFVGSGDCGSHVMMNGLMIEDRRGYEMS